MKLTLKIPGGVVAALFLAGVVLLVAVDAPGPVPATVMDDPDLPAIEVDGVRLHAEAFGPEHRPFVLVLHGGPGNDYRALLSLEALTPDFRVAFYDQRGAGLSQRVAAEQLTIDDYIEEVDGVARHFATDQPVHLIGHSWGAMLATAFAARHPDRVASLVLAEPGFLTPEVSLAFLDATHHMQPPMSFALLSHLVKTAVRTLKLDGPDEDAALDYFMLELTTGADMEGHPIGGYFCDGKLETASLDTWRLGGTAMMAAQSLADETGAVPIDFADGIDRFHGPVLLMSGDCNTLIGPEYQKKHHLGLFEDVRLEVVEGAGHTMFGEKPEETTALVRSFLAPLVAPPIDTGPEAPEKTPL
jgi:proline iminopeptidase